MISVLSDFSGITRHEHDAFACHYDLRTDG